MSETKYIKLSELVDKDFTVEKVWGFKWKMWDNVAKTMLTSDTYQPQHRKLYSVVTDKGTLDISANQLGSMFESTSKDGYSNIIDKTFHVKSNGKSGIDIRYFINPVFKKDTVDDEEMENDISLADIPF